MKNKIFDAVNWVRSIRDELFDRYKHNPAKLDQDLEEIRRKYAHIKTKEKMSFPRPVR